VLQQRHLPLIVVDNKHKGLLSTAKRTRKSYCVVSELGNQRRNTNTNKFLDCDLELNTPQHKNVIHCFLP